MKKHIGYKVEAESGFDISFSFRGFITYFDGGNIVITQSPRFERKQDAWQWISDTLAQWEKEDANNNT